MAVTENALNVSILVLMDSRIKIRYDMVSELSWQGFNPCFNG